MGADIRITVGRINRQLPAPTEEVQVSTEVQTKGTALAVFDNKRFQFGDFEFSSDIPPDVEIYRNYRLFAFLANVRGSVKPIVSMEKLQQITREFVDWLNLEHRKIEGSGGGWYTDPNDFIGEYAQYDIGEHSQVFYPLVFLTTFNYDQVAPVETENSNWRNPEYKLNDEGETYRSMFEGTGYFEFLNWAVAGNWHFVIFGFDS